MKKNCYCAETLKELIIKSSDFWLNMFTHEFIAKRLCCSWAEIHAWGVYFLTPTTPPERANSFTILRRANEVVSLSRHASFSFHTSSTATFCVLSTLYVFDQRVGWFSNRRRSLALSHSLLVGYLFPHTRALAQKHCQAPRTSFPTSTTDLRLY